VGLFDRVFRGSDEMFSLARAAVTKTIEKIGPDAPAAFGSTAYFLPCIYAYTGLMVTKMSELEAALEPIKALLTRIYGHRTSFRASPRPSRRSDRA
jgi:acetyl-CoA synthase